MRTTLCLALACAFALSARVAHPSDKPDPEPSEGRLLTRSGERTIDVPIEHTDVAIRVHGHMLDATITQTFKNPYDRKIEAVYLFPLPTDAAVHDMRITVGEGADERVIEGRIERRREAERIYTRARDKGHVAALLTQERPNLFTQSVANIERGARIRVTLRYVQPLAYQGGGYEIGFPMVAGPRYLPGGARDEAIQPAVLPPGMRSAHDISLRVDIDAGVSIAKLDSPSHDIVVERPDGRDATSSRATVIIAASDTMPNKDFVLRYQVAGAVPEFAVLAHRPGPDAAADADAAGPGPGSFYLLAQPPESSEVVGHREIIFVLDTSSSMHGAPLVKAKELIRRVLGGLRPHDTYQIVRFADAASALGHAPIGNRPRNIEYTLDWLERLEAAGGTEMSSGIDAALAVPHDPDRLRLVVFITDGYIGNEDEILSRVARDMGESRLFSFGVGSAVNRYLLEEMANMGRGDVQVVRPDEDTDQVVRAFHERIDRPVLTDIRIDWNGLDVRDIAPATVPDLFAGKPLVLSGRYARGGRAQITVHGKRAGRAVSFQVPVELPDEATDRPAVARVWARTRIAEMSRDLLRERDPALEEALIELALENRLLTRYTAFVAVDRSRVTDGGAAAKVRVPVEVPEGVRRIASPSVAYGGFGHGSIGASLYGSISPRVTAPGVYPMYARAPVSPTVRVGGGTVTGSLSKNVVRRYIRRHLPRVRHCYEKALTKDPSLRLVVKMNFVILPTGQVAAARVLNDADAVPRALAQCVTRAVSDIRFPAIAPDADARVAPMKVTYPFLLEPRDD